MSFRLVPRLVTLSDLNVSITVGLRYSTEFGSFG